MAGAGGGGGGGGGGLYTVWRHAKSNFTRSRAKGAAVVRDTAAALALAPLALAPLAPVAVSLPWALAPAERVWELATSSAIAIRNSRVGNAAVASIAMDSLRRAFDRRIESTLL